MVQPTTPMDNLLVINLCLLANLWLSGKLSAYQVGLRLHMEHTPSPLPPNKPPQAILAAGLVLFRICPHLTLRIAL
jgi:hypothetical protein